MKKIEKKSLKTVLIITVVYCLFLAFFTFSAIEKNGFCDLKDYLSDEKVITKECRLKLMKKKLEGHHGARYRLDSFFLSLKPNSEVLKEFDKEEMDFMCNKFNHVIDSDVYDKFCKQSLDIDK